MTKRIQVIVSPTGETTIKTTGFQGPECKAATKSLEAALGVPASEQLTAEYFQAAPIQHQQQQNN